MVAVENTNLTETIVKSRVRDVWAKAHEKGVFSELLQRRNKAIAELEEHLGKEKADEVWDKVHEYLMPIHEYHSYLVYLRAFTDGIRAQAIMTEMVGNTKLFEE